MTESQLHRLKEYLRELADFAQETQIKRWQEKVAVFLTESFGSDFSERFESLKFVFDDEWSNSSRQCGYLEALISEMQDKSQDTQPYETPAKSTIFKDRKKVFVVHGHDGEAKEKVSRYIEKLKLHAIVLHEQPNEGLTLVEKFELHSEVGYAVVLLTPDDICSSAKSKKDMKHRARQNVVLELGYFLGKLGRKRVAALLKGDVDIPSDLHGIVYINLDDEGAWKAKLAQEFVTANLDIDLSGVLQ